MPHLVRYQPVMRTVGQRYCVDPAVIAGVLSRQSQGGNFLVNVGSTGNVGNMEDGVRVVQVTLHRLMSPAAVPLRGTIPRAPLHGIQKDWCCLVSVRAAALPERQEQHLGQLLCHPQFLFKVNNLGHPIVDV